MAFRKFGGLNYSASNNIVRNNLANSDNLTISKKLGLLNSKIPVESHLDMSGNSIMNVGSISFFADGSVQTTAYDTTGGAPGNFTTGTFSGLLTANGGFQCTNANFSGGIQGPNASFTGISGNNANFNTLTCVTETITGTLGVSGQISANGGISGTTGYFNNLVVAGGTAYFVNIPLCSETGIGGYTPGSSGQLTTKAYVDSKITSVSTIQISGTIPTPIIYYPVLTSAIGPGQTLYGATSQLYMNTDSGLLNVYGVTATTTGFFGGLLSGAGGVTASTGFFGGLLSGAGGLTASTGFFKGLLSANGGITGATAFFSNTLSANGGFTGSTGFFGGLLSANGGFTGSTGFFGGLLSANGGFTGSTGFFAGLLSANGGITGATAFFSNTLSAAGGFTGSTGFFAGLLSANGGITGATAFFSNTLSAAGGFTGSTGFFAGLLSANGGITGATAFFSNTLSAAGGFTGSTGFFAGLLSANGGFTGATAFFSNTLSAAGGFTGSTGFFAGLLSANGGFTGATAFFSNTLSAAGGFTGSTGFFGRLLSAAAGITATTGYFSDLITANSGITSTGGYFSGLLRAASGLTASNAFISGGVTGLSSAYFGGLLSANGGITGATAFFSNTLSANGGFTASTGYFAGLLSAASGITASNVYASSGTFTNIKIPTLSGSTATINNNYNTVEGSTGDISIQPGTNGFINLWSNGTVAQALHIGDTSSNLSGLSVGWNNGPDGTGGKTVLINYAQVSNTGGFNFLSASNTLGLTSIGILPRVQPINTLDSSNTIPTTAWVQTAISSGSSTTASKINIMASGATSTICYIPFSPTGAVGPNNLLIDEFATAPSLTYQPSTNTLNVPGNIVCGGTGAFQKISINNASTITQIGNTLSFGLTNPGDVNFLTQSGYAIPGATTSAGIGFGWNATNAGGESVLINYQATGSTGGFDFYKVSASSAGSKIASISGNGTLTAASFNATSDYRIKENPVPIAETVDALRPLQYFNKATNKQDFGFLAHEVQELFPFLVEGEKDGDSNQSLNYMGLIALLVKEVQELKQRINNIV